MIAHTVETVSRMLTRRAPTTPTPMLTEAAPPTPWRGLPHVLTMEGAAGSRVLVIAARDLTLTRHSVTVAFQLNEPMGRVSVLVEPAPPARDLARLLSVLGDALLTCWRHHMAERGIDPLRAALFGQAASRLDVYIADTREAARTNDDPLEDQEAVAALAGDAVSVERARGGPSGCRPSRQ